MSDRKVSVLLGAGASKDAGLPLTTELAENIIDWANGHSPAWAPSETWIKSLNFIYGAMVGEMSRPGGNPRAAVNIERLISAVRLLENREKHEVAPFVANWNLGNLSEPRRPVSFRDGERLAKALEKNPVLRSSGRDIRQSEEIAKSVAVIAMRAAESSPADPFRDVEVNLLRAISWKLNALKSVDYLKPLADLAARQDGGLDVISLNYDVAVERMIHPTKVTLDQGADRWSPGERLRFEQVDNQLRLYKLHGSLSWSQIEDGTFLEAPKLKVQTSDKLDEPMPERPWIVVGDREKLATDGPTLELLRAAESALESTSHLVVVGYSFADDHINAVIRNWMLASDERTLAVVDPGWGNFRTGDRKWDLLKHYGFGGRGESCRMVGFWGGAAERLEEALTRTEMPQEVPNIRAQVDVNDDGGFQVGLTLEGHEWTSVNFFLEGQTRGGKEVDTLTRLECEKIYSNDPRISESDCSSILEDASLQLWPSGATIYLDFPTKPAAGAVMRVQGTSLDRFDTQTKTVPLVETE